LSAKFFWFLPTNGDSRSIVGASHASSHHTVPAGYRKPSLRYLSEVARAADHLGFEGVLTPTGTWCEDAWLTSAALLEQTERLKFLVAFRPGLVPPTLAAQQAATFQRFSEGRLLLNIVSGGDDVEQRRFGDWLSHSSRSCATCGAAGPSTTEAGTTPSPTPACPSHRTRCRSCISAARRRRRCPSQQSMSTST
jgi:alkanesulfonate monooxygenase